MSYLLFGKTNPPPITQYQLYKTDNLPGKNAIEIIKWIYGKNFDDKKIYNYTVDIFLRNNPRNIVAYYNIFVNEIQNKISLLEQFVDNHEFVGDAEFNFDKQIAQTILNGLKKLHEKNISTQPNVGAGRKFRKSRKGKRKNRKSRKYRR